MERMNGIAHALPPHAPRNHIISLVYIYIIHITHITLFIVFGVGYVSSFLLGAGKL